MRKHAVWLAVAVALAVGAGAGVYFSVDGGSRTTLPPVPKADQSPPLERATAEGIIPGYRAIRGRWGLYRYEVPSGIALSFPNGCGNRSCPRGIRPIIQIEYRRSAAAQARRVLALAQQWAEHTFEPPGYILNFYEVTTFGPAQPPARVYTMSRRGGVALTALRAHQPQHAVVA